MDYRLVLAVQIDTRKSVKRPYLFRTYSLKDSALVEPSKDSRLDDEKGGPPTRATWFPASITNVNQNIKTSTERINIKSVCLATAASPTYFPSVSILGEKFRDGALWMANPSMELYREVHSMHPDVDSPIYCFVSIGCGKQKRGGLPLLRPSLYEREQRKVDDVLQSRKRVVGQKFDYFRLNGPADLIDVKPSDWKVESNRKSITNRIERATKKYLEPPEVKKEIERLAKVLVDYRRQRARTARWEQFALGIEYTCNWCKEPQEDRDDLIAHVLKRHKEVKAQFPDKYVGILQRSQVRKTV
jgi:hypothetical protein